MDESNQAPAVTSGTGEQAATPAELDWFRKEIQTLQSEAGKGPWARRRWNDDIRFCRWAGQNDAGTKTEQALGGKKPFPFEGASDCRYPLADMIVCERVRVLVAAGMRAHLQVAGTEFTDEAAAGKVRTLLRWTIRNQLGRSYRREIEKVAQYSQADTPGIGVLGVFWHEERQLQRKTVAPGDVLAALAALFGDVLEPGELEATGAMLVDPARREQAAALLTELLPAIGAAEQALAIVDAWGRGEAADFVEPVTRLSVPRIVALRLGVDLFVPHNISEIRRSPWLFHREMLSRAELEARPVTHGYAARFVKKVIGEAEGQGFEGRTCLPDGIHAVTEATVAVGSLPTVEEGEDFRGKYEVITAYWKAVNQEGVLGIYQCTFSAFVERAATPKMLCDYSHGEYPYVEFPCEILGERLSDSRGVPERAATQQATLKHQHDARNDATDLGVVPPVRVPANRPNVPFTFGPLTQVPERRPNEYGWMPPPAFPAVAEFQAKETRRQVDEYWGRSNPEVSPDEVVLQRQDMVDRFLASLADALQMIVQLEQQYLTDAEIARVVGGRGLPVARSVEEIQGKFDITLDFDVRTLSPEYVLKLAESVSQWVLPADTRQTVQRDRYVALILGAINPMLAEATIRPAEEADQAEADDEDGNVAKMMAGVEPALMESGQNFDLRLRRLETWAERNPAAAARMPPDAVPILETRLKHLRFMVQQERNKLIGRVGAEPALGEGAAE